jgi:hypothetical protein
MSQRLSGYHTVASNARLRQQLAAKGGYLPSGDFIASRMAELRGSPAHSPRRSVAHFVQKEKKNYKKTHK